MFLCMRRMDRDTRPSSTHFIIGHSLFIRSIFFARNDTAAWVSYLDPPYDSLS